MEWESSADVRSLLYKVLLVVMLIVVACLWLFRDSWMRTPAAAGVGFMRPFLVGWDRFTDGALQLAGIGERSERAKLDELEAEVTRLRVAVSQTQGLQKENRELRELIGLPRPPGWRFIAAQIIARDPATWHRKFRIDRGRGDGITEGDAVVASGGVIGRISECTATTAKVMTILDRGCRLSVVVGRQAAPGILGGRSGRSWQTQYHCLVNFLRRDGVYETGDAVHTSGLGFHVPGGLPVGNLTAQDDGTVATTIDSIYSQVQMKPVVDAADVSRVVVVTRNRRRRQKAQQPH